MSNLNYNTHEPIHETDTENRPAVAKGEEVRGGMEWEVGVSRRKLLCIEWINNEVLLFSTGNYRQYPMINHNLKKDKKECTCVCVCVVCVCVLCVCVCVCVCVYESKK